MRRQSSNRWLLKSVALFVALSGCNGLLGNDPRTWDPPAGEAGAPPTGGRAGAAGKAGTSGEPGAMGGEGGEAGGSSGGTGANGAQGGDAGNGGEAGEAGDSSAGVGGKVCECKPGEHLERMEACGDCMTGTRVQTQTCTDACVWGPWGDFGECTGVTAICSPGTPGTQAVACPCGGTKTQTRSCSTTCEWSPWMDTSGCDLDCCTEIVYCNTPDNISPASRGTWCRETSSACSNDEVYSDCLGDAAVVCGAVVPELYVEYR